MDTFIKASFGAIKEWILGVFTLNGFINGGWLIAGTALVFLGFPFLGGGSLGIFAEKNRSALVKLYKQVKEGIRKK